MSLSANEKMEARGRKKRQEGKISKEEYEEGTRLYFESIKELPTLFIEVKKASKPYVYLDIRNLIVLLIYESYRLEKWVKLCIVCKRQPSEDSKSDVINKFATLKLNSYVVFKDSTEFPLENNFDCDTDTRVNCKDMFRESRKHPSITVEDKKMIICGISSVLRFIFKHVCYKIEEDMSANSLDKDILSNLQQFLGFRGGCLQACAESSIWTKFCEVDMIDSVNEVVKLIKSTKGTETSEVSTEMKIPANVKRFENHLSLPVKIHNFQRVIQDIKKANQGSVGESSHGLENNVLITELKHEFAEGPILLLSDLILFPSFHFFVQLLGNQNFAHLFPRTWEWYDKIHNQFLDKVEIEIDNFQSYDTEKLQWSIPEVPVQSLYLRDTNRYKPALRQFTRQYEVEEALECLKVLNIASLELQQQDPNFIWEDIPLLAHPEGGNLPLSRQKRKRDQLASMAYYALQVYSLRKHRFKSSSDNRRFRIVDFCSGGGHVGILLAWLLPDCDVVLVENKDESLRRAQERISGLGLLNVFCYQSNLDYFEGNFDMGIALHACGTATDLVISKCVKVNASFVCCPCCYGAVQENHILTYPQSTIFQKLSLRHYLVICHASDQTEAEEKTAQGKQCMALIDTDRCLYATENQYDVKLCKIVPETASPKNHILVAVASV